MKIIQTSSIIIKLLMLSLVFNSVQAAKHLIPEYGVEWKRVPPQKALFDQEFPRDKVIYTPKNSEAIYQSRRSTTEIKPHDSESSATARQSITHQNDQEQDRPASIFEKPLYQKKDGTWAEDTTEPTRQDVIEMSPKAAQTNITAEEKSGLSTKQKVGLVGLGIGLTAAGTAAVGAAEIGTVAAIAEGGDVTVEEEN